MIVSGFESYRPAFEMTWTTAQPVTPRQDEASVEAEKQRDIEVAADNSGSLAREIAAYQFAMRVNDRALAVLQPFE